MVTLYLPQMYQYLGDESISNAEICGKVKLCKFEPEIPVNYPKVESRGVGCGVCKTVVAVGRQYAELNQDEIVFKLNEKCEKLGFLKRFCKDMVALYMPQMYEYLGDESVSDAEICMKIKVCENEQFSVSAAEERGVGCSVCKTIVEVGRLYAGENEETIQEELNQRCEKLGFLKRFCKDMVQLYLPQMYEYLGDPNVSTVEICQRVKVCMDEAMAAMTVQQLQVESRDVGCKMCQTVVEVGRLYVGLDEQQITEKMKESCESWGYNTGLCKAIVMDNMPQMYQHMSNPEISNKEVCQKIKVCY
jgi:hypothetical protein